MNLKEAAIDYFKLINDKNNRYESRDPDVCAEEDINELTNTELLDLISYLMKGDHE